jgi:uncharacterized protein with von Willebrand factor type A (vWA) domain
VGISEDVDAAGATKLIDSDDRGALRTALAATLVKTESHRPTFDLLFDLYFRGATPEDAPGDPDESREDFLDEVLRALRSATPADIEALARRAVDMFGRVENSPSGTRYFAYPVFRALPLDALQQRAMAQGSGGAGTPLEGRLRDGEFAERVRMLRAAIEADVRRRAAEQNGPEEVARYNVRPLPEDVSFLSATSADLADLQRVVRPIARKLAARVAIKRRRARRGQLDVRQTVRHSLSSGGVPFQPRFRHRPPHRPELFVVCDISGSVAYFSRFALMLVHSLQSQFSRVRSFVFVEKVEEVTRFFEHEDFVAAVGRMNREVDVTWVDGHSNYGSSLEDFWDMCERDLGPKATVLVLGDARNNFRATGAGKLKAVRAKAHRTYWLNPEGEGYWDSGDSVASEYAAVVDAMVEVRNLRQLEDFIATVL